MRKLVVIKRILESSLWLEKSEWYWVYRIAFVCGLTSLFLAGCFSSGLMSYGMIWDLNKIWLGLFLLHVLISFKSVLHDYIYDKNVVEIMYSGLWLIIVKIYIVL